MAQIIFLARGLVRIARQSESTAVAMRKLGRAANIVRRDFLSVAAGVGLVGSSTVAIRSSFRLLGNAFEAASNESELLAESYQFLKNQADGFNLALGETITHGNLGNEIMGTLQGVLHQLTVMVNDSRDSFRVLVRFGLQSTIMALRLVNGLVGMCQQAFQLLRMAVEGVKIAVYAVAASIVPLVAGSLDLLIRGIGAIVDGFVSLIEGASAVARVFNEDMARGIQYAADAFDGMVETLDEWENWSTTMYEGAFNDMVDGLTDMSRGAMNANRTFERVTLNMHMNERALYSLSQQLSSNTMTARRATVENDENTRSMDDGTAAAQRLARALADVVASRAELMAAKRSAHLEHLMLQIEGYEKLHDVQKRGIEDIIARNEEQMRQEREKAEAHRLQMIERREAMSAYAESAIKGTQGIIDLTMLQGKAHKKATGLMLVTEGIRQFATGVGYMFTIGMQQQGAALIAQSINTFAQARKLGASGGGSGGGAGGGRGDIAFTQDITFVGSTAGQDTRAIADSIRRATRDGVLQAQGAQ